MIAVFLVTAAFFALPPAAGQVEPAGQRRVTITTVVPDASAGTVTITGDNFGFIPFVTLDLIPLTIESVGGNRIVAAAPIKLMPARTYLLTLSYGPSAEESASIPVVLGGEAGAGADNKSSPSTTGIDALSSAEGP